MKLSPRTGALMPTAGFSRANLHDPRTDGVGTAWRTHDGLLVISTLADMFLPGTNDTKIGPTWHVSVSRRGQRPTGHDLMRVIAAFEMPEWDEDNHHPGVARHLFCPVDPAYRTACECKITETLITDPADGYRWTTDDQATCRGCQYEAMVGTLTGKRSPCPLHRGAA